MEFIASDSLSKWHSDWINIKGADVAWDYYLADRINSQLSELQAGNRERVIRLRCEQLGVRFESLDDNNLSFSEEADMDAILSVVVPGSDEVERLREERDWQASLCIDRVNTIAELRTELAALCAAMPKFKPGDKVWILWGLDIRECKIVRLGVCDADLLSSHEEQPRYPGVPLERLHATEAECRAAIPVEHLKGES